MGEHLVDLIAGSAALLLVLACALLLGLADLSPEGGGQIEGAIGVLSTFAVAAFGRYTLARRRALGLQDEEGEE